MPTATNILGIPCQLRTPFMRQAVRDVLGQIRERCPKDFASLQSLVRDIRPVSKAEAAVGTLGEWKEFSPDPDDPATWGWGSGDATPGHLYLNEHETEGAAGVIAHEFGHACVTQKDLDKRGAAGDEWAEELSADWYAYKWGFGREIARRRKTRKFSHHGPTPGQLFSIGGPDVEELHFRVTRSFLIHPMGRAKRRSKKGKG